MRKTLLLLTLLLVVVTANAQLGGMAAFPYLTLSTSSRESALGGLAPAIKDDDVSLFVDNPSLLSYQMNNKLSLSYQPFSGKIDNSFAAYSHTFGKDWSVGLAVQFINYGKFVGTDDLGNLTGSFFANDYAITAGVSKSLTNRITYGANVKYFYSVLSAYSSSAVAVDVAGTYNDTAKGVTLSAVIANIGRQLTTYTPGDIEKVPFDLEAGISKRLIHTPFLFSIALHHLQQFNIRYNDTSIANNSALTLDTTAQTTKPKKYIADNIARHVIVGVEIIIGKNLRIEIGYNDLRREELAFDARKGLAGFNLGVNVKISGFTVGYSYSFYNVAGGYNSLTLGLDLNKFLGKGKM